MADFWQPEMEVQQIPRPCDHEVLTSGFDLGGLRLRNRIVMAPMTRECAPDGVPTLEMARYYARRAEGGVGMIVTEGAAPNEEGRFGRNVPRLYGADALAGWARVVAPVKAAGAAILAQIWHVGGFTPSMINMPDSLDVSRVSPSGLAATGYPVGTAMTTRQIARTVRDYGQAARQAREVGFDGVEIHAAHGYLPDQFFWSESNLRKDCYGGDIAARCRFAAEVIHECKAQAGSDFIVTLRISQWKQLDFQARVVGTPEELSDWLKPLVASGVDGFHVSTRRFWDQVFSSSGASLASWVRRLSGRPVIAVGSALLDRDFKAADGKKRGALSPRTLQWAADAIEDGEFDLIAFGRALLANPDLAQRLVSGEVAGLRDYDRSYLETLK
ncbi:12-oxophytodienoate reductase [Pontivivens nitratireducens]|uniref:oxidoreductase n=1 Tax=Pontivivens nitratireducens TaxID=2758038 RepID=UPI001C8EFC40|nr:12-oxophytodienoate reductase [Pontibrevibacter nitratireducens]